MYVYIRMHTQMCKHLLKTSGDESILTFEF